MSKPCQDDHSIRFRSFADMMTYHDRQSKESRWEHEETKNLRIEPLDGSSPLYGNRSEFAPEVSADAVDDTAKKLGLAVRLKDVYYPVRDTAYKGLLDRAKIGGSALPKLRRCDLANVINACLLLCRDEALLLVRNEKVSAVHAGGDMDYSVLPIDKLFEGLKSKLDERFPDNVFAGGYSDHSLTSAAWSFPEQKEDLLGIYGKTLAVHGKATLADKLMPGIRFSTSDTGVASAKVAALLLGLPCPIHIGGMIFTEHRGRTKTEDFHGSLDMLFAQLKSAVHKLMNLMDVYLDHPINAMTAVCKKLSMPKKAALEAISMFEMSHGGGTATAHDIYMAMQEIMFILKTENVCESKMLPLEESMARALTLNWTDYDFAKEVNW